MLKQITTCVKQRYFRDVDGRSGGQKSTAFHGTRR